ncbi:hypothetical protein D1B31_13825 [Neobacillus notoginsengisoli]|uniref:Uncharacterized protein n=2 Tax=Neobacillus notoginsengisoli TaxID=1578198 RepID=A0A417YSS1_9BACI|nr:hypothetical protein D1B31_13825 [Neobacillus notoginsengisoli]
MELNWAKCSHWSFWRVFPLMFVLISINNILYNWELPLFGFYEFEDLGRLLFVVSLSACESAFLTHVLIWVFKKIKGTAAKHNG